VKRHQRRPGKGAPFGSPSRPDKVGWKAIVRALLILAVLGGAIGSIAMYSIANRGLSAHDEPSRLEEMLARAMRSWATPASVRNQSNPVQATPEVLNQALEHYADHCATCHANDGSGDTEIGRGLYPRAPDMRSTQTQSLTDGELFSIIHRARYSSHRDARLGRRDTRMRS
jgi:mono/diheme cytochrome c family protein